MNDEGLNFELPERKSNNPPPGAKGILALLLILILLVGANLFFVLRPRNTMRRPDNRAKSERELALKLEKQDLKQPAIDAWRRYLQNEDLNAEDQAKISYRIAKHYQDLNEYGKAVEFYYRSETAAELPEISSEINRRIQRCFEAMGKVTALQQDLKDRTAIDGYENSNDAEVLAEIRNEKITSADLNLLIEARLDRQLEQVAGHLTPDQRREQKEAWLKQFSADEQRFQFLTQHISALLLAQKARLEKLHRDPEVVKMLHQQADELLAQHFLKRVLDEKIDIGENDLRMYHRAFISRYATPERAKIAHILFEDKEKAEAALLALKQGESFQEMAANLSVDEKTAANGGLVDGWIVKEQSIFPGHGKAEGLSAAVFATETGAIASVPIKSKDGFHVVKVLEKEAPKERPFEEVREQVYRDYRAQKEQDVQRNLFDKLQDEFDVVVHTGKFKLQSSEEEGEHQVRR